MQSRPAAATTAAITVRNPDASFREPRIAQQQMISRVGSIVTEIHQDLQAADAGDVEIELERRIIAAHVAREQRPVVAGDDQLRDLPARENVHRFPPSPENADNPW